MGKQFSCLQIMKPSKTIHSHSHSKQRISTPQSHPKSPTPSPPSKNNKLNTQLHSYHTTTTQTNIPNIQLQLVHKNTNKLTIPSPKLSPNSSKSDRNLSITGDTLISNTNISSLSSAVSILSTLSNASSHNETTPTSHTLNTVCTNTNNNDPMSSSETSISIVTTENETSISDTTNHPTSPIYPTDSSDNNRYNFIISPTAMDMTMDGSHSTHTPTQTHAKTLSYDGDIEPESNDDTVVNTATHTWTNCSDIYSQNISTKSCTTNSNSNGILHNESDSESVQTFIVCQGSENDNDSNEKDIRTYDIKGSDGRNSNVSNVSNISNISNQFLSNLSNIKLPNKLSVTTQLSQLLDEHVKIITLTQTMDVKDIPKENINAKYSNYNGGLVQVNSTSVTVSPNNESDAINPLFDNEFEKCKLDINDIEKWLVNANNMEYVD